METQHTFTPEQESLPKKNDNSALWKGVIVSILVLALLLPVSYIKMLVAERSERHEQVIQEISNQWAGEQMVSGPVLMIPYYETTQKDGRTVTQKMNAYFIADKLSVNSNILPEVRKRSLYKVQLMKSELRLSGTFKSLQLAALGLSTDMMLWGEARLLVGLSDTKGLSKEVQLDWGTDKLVLQPGVPENSLCTSGLSVPVKVNAEGSVDFNITMNVRSSRHLYFSLMAGTTDATLSSTWSSPSFTGMPDTAEITAKGFRAHWSLSQASRAYPRQWKQSVPNLGNNTIGVSFANSDESYIKTDRVVKYAILFIALTFAVFFLIEVLQRIQIHPLQYGLVGIALCIFYTLLLSISEYTGFDTAYIIASLATILLIGMYVWSIFHKPAVALSFTVGLTALYAYIYFLIQLEEMSLIFGSIALFLVVAAIMFFTRKVNWYQLNKRV